MSIKQRSSNGRAVRSAGTVAQDWRAWDLRCQHKTYREIGEELGIDPSTAYDSVLRATRMLPNERAEEMTKSMLAEMDRMARSLWAIADDDSTSPALRVKTIGQLLRVQERRSRLIGLDAPTRRAIDVITPEAVDDLIENLKAEIAEYEAVLGPDGLPPLD
jgi:hypothetical protein